MLGVFLQGLVNAEDFHLFHTLLRQPEGEAWFCLCVCVFLLVRWVKQIPAPLHVNYV